MLPPLSRARPTLAASLAALVLGVVAPQSPAAATQEPLPGAAQEPSPRVEPVRIGEVVDDVAVVDVRGQRRRLADLGDASAFVLLFVTCDCPMVGRVFPAFESLAQRFRDRGVRFVAVNCSRSDSIRAMADQALEYRQSAFFVRDPGLTLTRALGVDRTTTAVVLDGDRHLRYRGRIDDRVRYANVRDDASREDLRLAIEAVLDGKAVEVAVTDAEGCKVGLGERVPVADAPTWNGLVHSIVQRRCVPCHRDGGAAPFPLEDHEDVLDQLEMIGEVVERQRMPPWHASDAYGEFINRRELGDDERRALLDFVRAGAPRGDGEALTATPDSQLPKWRIGEPDLVLRSVGPMRLPADGVIPYAYIVLPHDFRVDTWIEAVEIRPSNKRVLHHANLAAFRPQDGFSQDGFITGFVPGGDAMILDPGTAMRIPAGSRLGLQAHYVTTGKPETDRIEVGLRFPRGRVERVAEVHVISNRRFRIPPGVHDHEVRARRTLAHDITVIGYFAHMHLRGRDMTFAAVDPAGAESILLRIPNYDFEWQSSYRCKPGAVRLAAGTRLTVVAHFDNSAFNPFNPDPSAEVRFGEQTFDEMMYGFVYATRDGSAANLDIDPATGAVRTEAR
ncbi:MAG: redoxin family protein [Planctomycetota bacterium]